MEAAEALRVERQDPAPADPTVVDAPFVGQETVAPPEPPGLDWDLGGAAVAVEPPAPPAVKVGALPWLPPPTLVAKPTTGALPWLPPPGSWSDARQAPPVPAAWGAPGPAVAPHPAVAEPEPHVEPGPNWMMAFVCLWAGGTALNEAWYTGKLVGLGPSLLRNVAFTGYGILGLGLLAFALEALQTDKKRSPAMSLAGALVPAMLTLIGVILLVMSHDPGRRI